MSDATLWINNTNFTATVKNGSAVHTMPLWAFEGMRDVIVAEAEKKVEVAHRDFDIQQELLDRYRAENTKLRELLRAAYSCTNAGPSCLECRVVAGGCTLLSAMRELGVEV